MTSPHVLHAMPYELKRQPRQLGWTRFWVEASFAERSPARFVRRVVTRSAGRPRLARAPFTHFTMRPSMYVAVEAAAGAGCAAGPTAKPRKAIRAAASRMPGFRERVVGTDMARIVTWTSSFVNPNERPVRTYGVASRQRDWGPGLGALEPEALGSGTAGCLSGIARRLARGCRVPGFATRTGGAPPRRRPRTGSRAGSR